MRPIDPPSLSSDTLHRLARLAIRRVVRIQLDDGQTPQAIIAGIQGRAPEYYPGVTIRVRGDLAVEALDHLSRDGGLAHEPAPQYTTAQRAAQQAAQPPAARSIMDLADDAATWNFTPLSDVRPAPPEACLAWPVLWAGRRTLLSARGGIGKSTFARQLAHTLSTGAAWVDGEARPPVRVGWISGDEDVALIRRLFDDDAYPDLSEIMVSAIDDVPSPEALHARIQEQQIGLLVIDPVADLIMRGVHSSARLDKDEVRKAWRVWLPMCYARPDGQPGIRSPAVLAIHHQHRPREMRSADQLGRFHGSVGYESSADFMFDFDKNDLSLTARILSCGKSRAREVVAGQVFYYDHADARYTQPPRPSVPLVPGGARGAAGTTLFDATALRERLLVEIAANPLITLTAACRACGIRRGSRSPQYQAFRRIFMSIHDVESGDR